jgi:hypothetical protein
MHIMDAQTNFGVIHWTYPDFTCCSKGLYIKRIFCFGGKHIQIETLQASNVNVVRNCKAKVLVNENQPRRLKLPSEPTPDQSTDSPNSLRHSHSNFHAFSELQRKLGITSSHL